MKPGYIRPPLNKKNEIDERLKVLINKVNNEFNNELLLKKRGDKMDFGEALKAMKSGKKIRRSTWTDGAYLILGTEEQYGKEIFNYHSNGQGIDCIESMTIWTDALLAEDWEVIEDLQEVNVITETVEYYICPVCKNKIRLQKNAYTVTCITCKFSVLLKRD